MLEIFLDELITKSKKKFKNIKVDIIDDSLQVARDKFNNRQKFDALKTASTPVQRKQMNQRLNLT